MRRCKRNILLIILGLMIGVILFIPCSEEVYTIPPVYVADVEELVEIRESEQEQEPFYLERKSLNKINFRFIVFYFKDNLNLRQFLQWKENKLKKMKEMAGKLPSNSSYSISTEFTKLFKRKYKGEFSYSKFKLSIFVIEFVLIALLGGFAYIIFCVVLRKREGET